MEDLNVFFFPANIQNSHFIYLGLAIYRPQKKSQKAGGNQIEVFLLEQNRTEQNRHAAERWGGNPPFSPPPLLSPTHKYFPAQPDPIDPA